VPGTVVVVGVAVGVVVPVVSVPPLSSVLSNVPCPQVVVPAVMVEVRTMSRSMMDNMVMMMMMNVVDGMMSSDAGSSSSGNVVPGASGVLQKSLNAGNSSFADVDAQSVRDASGQSSAQTLDQASVKSVIEPSQDDVIELSDHIPLDFSGDGLGQMVNHGVGESSSVVPASRVDHLDDLLDDDLLVVSVVKTGGDRSDDSFSDSLSVSALVVAGEATKSNARYCQKQYER